MAKHIFTNRSYLVGFNFDAERVAFLTAFAQRKNFKFVHEPTLQELCETLPRVKHLIGCFVSTENLDQSGIQQISELLSQTQRIAQLFDAGTTQASFALSCEQYIAGLVPARLEELVVFAADFLVPFIFPGVQTTFSATQATSDFETDLFVTCDCLDGSLNGKGYFKLNLANLHKTYPQYREVDPEETLDCLRELSNQFLGSINYNMGKLGIHTSNCLPVTIQKGSTISSSIYCPSVSVADENHIFTIDFGFVDAEGSTQVTFGNILFDRPEEDVELF